MTKQTCNLAVSCLIAGMFFSLFGNVHGAYTVSGIFTDNMVIQRDKPVSVWGWGDANESITVSFAGQSKTAAVDNGKWRVTLAAMAANSTGQSMTIASSGSASTVFTNVVIGDVWVCSGQSNMAALLSYALDGGRAAVTSADIPKLRFYNVGQNPAEDPVENCTGTWKVSSPQTVNSGCSAVAFFFGRKLVNDIGVPIGLVVAARGGTPLASWAKESAMKVLDLPNAAPADASPLTAKAPVAADVSALSAQANYNGMIHPLTPMAIRGAIWYQGEADVHQRAGYYQKLFPAMVKSWRETFKQGDFPFYFVQIAPYNYNKESQDAAGIREQQRKSIGLIPNSGMACIMDKGTLDNIHPPYKTEPGERLALWALAKDYGQNVVYAGPLFKKHAVEGNSIRVFFDYATGLTTQGGSLTTFEIMDSGGTWHQATATIDGKTIVVRANGVSNPKHVRYAWDAWDDAKEAEFWNGAGLPASSFRTDDWW